MGIILLDMSVSFVKSISFANHLLLIILVLELIDSFTLLGLDRFGILPWNVIGLIGIVFGPLLHANWEHLLVNSVPLWVNTVLLFSDRKFKPEYTFVWIWIGSGIGTWLLGGFRGEQAIHIGASSLILGLICYLILMGIFLGRIMTILISLVVIFYFGGLLSGIFPNPYAPKISWEGHFSGAFCGVVLAFHNRFFLKKSDY